MAEGRRWNLGNAAVVVVESEKSGGVHSTREQRGDS